jgi:hypothetical protein
VSTNSGHCLNTLTVVKSSSFPTAGIQDSGRSCQSNVAKYQDKGGEKDYFPFIAGQNSKGQANALPQKNRLITSHKRAGLRMDDDPVPKALIDAMDDLDDFKPFLEALHTLRLV